jgi:hypothetical protein
LSAAAGAAAATAARARASRMPRPSPLRPMAPLCATGDVAMWDVVAPPASPATGTPLGNRGGAPGSPASSKAWSSLDEGSGGERYAQ